MSLSRKREGPGVGGSSTIAAEAEAEEDPLLDPGVDPPTVGAGLGGADRAPTRGRRGARRRRARASSPRASRGASANSASIRSASSRGRSRGDPSAGGAARAGPRASRSLGGRAQGQAEALLAEAEEGQRGLHRDRVRLHEVQVHEVAAAGCGCARASDEVAARRRPRRGRAWGRGPGWRPPRSRPRPRGPSSARVKASSPERTSKPDGRSRRISIICPRLPEASFTAAMLRVPARRRCVFASMLLPVRPGHVVDHDGHAGSRRRWRRSAGRSPRASACCSRGPPTGSPCTPRPAVAFDLSIGGPRVVAPRSREHGLAAGLVDRDLDDALLLLGGQGGALAGRAAGHEHVDAPRHLPRTSRRSAASSSAPVLRERA